MFEYDVDVVGRLNRFDIFRVYPLPVFLKQIIIGYEGGLVHQFFIDYKDREGLLMRGGSC